MNNSKINGKTVMVSGGVGTIGSALVKKLVNDYTPKEIRIFDNNEGALFTASSKYADRKNVKFLLGDVKDKDRVIWALKGVNTVFHAAALKHVAFNEASPFESVKTNVLGTQNMLEATLINQAKIFVNISTDKAANPTSTMGASKLLTERLTVGANHFNGSAKTIFTSVRFGNVLNSSGSVLPIFIEQLKRGGPITITDKGMIRYFMTIDEAVKLIFLATALAKGEEVFILKMPLLKIIDLAETLIETQAKKFGQDPKKIKIKVVGKRPGENLYEKIVTKTEALKTLELKEMYVLPNINYNYYQRLGGKPVRPGGIVPDQLLDKKQIRKLLTKVI
jgi:FlaA1/EpsC-like NDP-sugar epimerase